jgi:ribosome-associated heat shock protein Hsp15
LSPANPPATRFDETAARRMTSRLKAPPSAESPSVRLDIWLWAARFFKTRTLGKQAIEGGKVAVNDAPVKPAKTVRVGDRLAIRRGEESFVVDVIALTEQRGPASVAQTLYRETDQSRAAREALREQRRLEGAGFSKPATKPDKRARRLIRALGDIDAF